MLTTFSVLLLLFCFLIGCPSNGSVDVCCITVSQVSSDVLALYNIVETNFRPMSIVKDSQPHLESLTKTGGDVAR